MSLFIVPTAESTFINTLIYGASGTGKTVFAGSFPKPCIVDCEKGWQSIKAVHGFTPAVVPVKSKAELVAAYSELASGEHDFETVIIDSLTDLNQFIVNDVMDRNPTRRRDSKDVPAQMDWMESGRVMEKMVYLFRDLPMHVVFIAGERTFGEGADSRTLPNVSPSLAEKLPHLVDVTLYSSVVTGEDGVREYVGQTIPAKGRSAKDRSNALPTPYVALDWQALSDAYGLANSTADGPDGHGQSTDEDAPAGVAEGACWTCGGTGDTETADADGNTYTTCTECGGTGEA